MKSRQEFVKVDGCRDETGFPAGIMYGMAGMAAIGVIAIFVISNRKIKCDSDQGQTGIRSVTFEIIRVQ